MSIRLAKRTAGSATVVSVSGEVDVHTCSELQAYLIDLVDAGAGHVVADLSEVTFLDSSGLGALVGVNKRLAQSQGRLAVVCADPQVLRVFSLTRLDEVLTIQPTVADATGSEAGA